MPSAEQPRPGNPHLATINRKYNVRNNFCQILMARRQYTIRFAGPVFEGLVSHHRPRLNDIINVCLYAWLDAMACCRLPPPSRGERVRGKAWPEGIKETISVTGASMTCLKPPNQPKIRVSWNSKGRFWFAKKMVILWLCCLRILYSISDLRNCLTAKQRSAERERSWRAIPKGGHVLLLQLFPAVLNACAYLERLGLRWGIQA